MFVIFFFLFSRLVVDPPDATSTKFDDSNNGDCYKATHKDKLELNKVNARDE